MRVIATKMGFYGGNRIRVGQEFNVPEGFTGKWFVPVPTALVEKPGEENAVEAKKPRRKVEKPGESFRAIAEQDAETAQGAG